jgi:tRNA A37 methylthiotransferase MiaB
MAGTSGVVPYYDISFQHASEPLLRRMRRFGGRAAFLDLLERVRSADPAAGVRTNVIVGFPGETEADLAELTAFLESARMDVVGVFGYSDEDGTEAEHLDGHLPEGVVSERVERATALVEELTARRAEERIGESVEVLVESVDLSGEGDGVIGRTAYQGPDVDGITTLVLSSADAVPAVGDLVPAVVVASEGVDLLARPR